MPEATHAVIHSTDAFPAAKLGKFDGALFPLQKTRFTQLASIILVIDNVRYRAHATPVHEEVQGSECVVYHVSPEPLQEAES